MSKQPRYLLRLAPRHGPACTGRQLEQVLSEVASAIGQCEWYAFDVAAIGSAVPDVLHRAEDGPRRIGSTAALAKVARNVEQFLSGVFLAVPTGVAQPVFARSPATEDEPFAPIEPAVLEIRAFDTSYFEVYTDSEEMLEAAARTEGTHEREIRGFA